MQNLQYRKYLLSFCLIITCFLSGRTYAQTIAPGSAFSLTHEPPEGLASESEAGILLVSGNSRAQNFNFKHFTSYRWPENTVQARGRFLKATAQGRETADQWGVSTRYERRLIPRLGAFAGQLIEGDPFSGIRQRYGTDVGLRKILWWGEVAKAATELGYRYQIENRTRDPKVYSQLIRWFGEFAYYWNPKVMNLLNVEALPNLRDAHDWQLNADLSLQAEMTSVLSLKTTYSVRFDHEPANVNLKKTDTVLTTALVAKF